MQRPGKNGGARLASVHPSLGADSAASRVSLGDPVVPVCVPCGEGKNPRRQLPRHVRPEQLHQLLQSLHVQVRERECQNLASSLTRQRLQLSEAFRAFRNKGLTPFGCFGTFQDRSRV